VQLNCICDHTAKQQIIAAGTDGTTQGRLFPLEPIGIFVRGEKMTLETGEQIRFWAHHQLAQKFYHEKKMLSYEQFNEVDWESIHCTLHDLPRLFQVWAAKHVLGVAGTMHFLLHQDMRSPLYPSCQECSESCKHIAMPRYRTDTCVHAISDRGGNMDGKEQHTPRPTITSTQVSPR
jgi:hypothetical protein